MGSLTTPLSISLDDVQLRRPFKEHNLLKETLQNRQGQLLDSFENLEPSPDQYGKNV